MATTIPGGDTINTSGLTPQQQQQLGDGLAALTSQGYNNATVTSSLNDIPTVSSGTAVIVEVPASSLSGDTITVPEGVTVLVIKGDISGKTIVGNPNLKIITFSGDGDFNTGGMGKPSSVLGGAGDSNIDGSSSNQDPYYDVGGGSDTVTLGAGTNTVTSSGNLTVKGGGGSDTIDLTGNGNKISLAASGHITTNLTGNGNRVTIATGMETVNVTGKGNVIVSKRAQGVAINESGPVGMNFTGAGNDTVTLGDGSNRITDKGPITLLGGGPSGNGHNQIDLRGSTRVDLEADGNNRVLVGASQNSRTSPTVHMTVGGGDSDTGTNNDTIVATSKVSMTTTGDPGNIDFTGIGNDSFTLNGGGNTGSDIDIDSAKARITINGGAQTLKVDEQGAKITESPNAGGSNMTLTGNDTISLGTGNDTVVDRGGATIFGGGGNFQFTGGAGGRDQVAVGSGNATLIGNGGDNVFRAGSGQTSMTGGAGSRDTFVGGSGFDTMDAQGAKSAVFQFDSSNHGGTHTINHFQTGPDKLDLNGYDTTQVLAGAQVVGGNTILSLGDGTTITLVGFTHLTAADFK